MNYSLTLFYFLLDQKVEQKIKALDLFWVRHYEFSSYNFILSEPFSSPSVFLFFQ